MTSRRTFIKNSGIAGAGIFLTNDVRLKKNYPIGLQMYTVRDLINDKNVEEVIGKIAAIGYRELEIIGYTNEHRYWGLGPEVFASLLRKNNLSAPGAHVSFEPFFNNDNTGIEFLCDAAKRVGNKYITIGWIDEKYRQSAEDYHVIAKKLAAAAPVCKKYLLQLCYHNHDFEFKKLSTGETGFDILLAEAGTGVQFELDLFWATKAGVDPVKFINDHPGKFVMWHVKDLDKNSGTFTEVGTGVVNFKDIFPQSKRSGMLHFFVEQDTTTKDVIQSITESFNYVNRQLLHLLK